MDDVRSSSERWFRAWLHKDAEVVERLAADDYLYVGPEGAVMDRAKILSVIRAPSYRLERGERTEIVVRALGADAALVRHRYRGEGSFEGRAFSDDQRCVMIWERRSGEWRLVMEQCSGSAARKSSVASPRPVEARAGRGGGTRGGGFWTRCTGVSPSRPPRSPAGAAQQKRLRNRA